MTWKLQGLKECSKPLSLVMTFSGGVKNGGCDEVRNGRDSRKE